MFTIMQGDEYNIRFLITTKTGIATPEILDDVEITIDDVIKTLKKGEIRYDENKQLFVYPMKQTDSFSFFAGTHTAQIRCKFKNGDVIGIPLGEIDVGNSMSKEVL